jgi:hypothetical protein
MLRYSYRSIHSLLIEVLIKEVKLLLFIVGTSLDAMSVLGVGVGRVRSVPFEGVGVILGRGGRRGSGR